MPVTPCPAPAKLEALVLGRLSGAEADDLEGHLSDCPTCAETVPSLAGDDELSHALHPPLKLDDTPRRALAAAVIPLLKRLRPGDVTGTWASADDNGATRERPADAPTDSTVSDIFPFLSPPLESDEIGRLGPYRVLDVLGAGGMGIVFRAEDPALRRLVALKVVRPKAVASPAARARFVEEARALARLEHDHIVTAYYAGEDNGVPFLAMPLLSGQTLQARLDGTTGPVEVDEILRVGREIATGLAVAHARGFVHRDIKPANVWLESRAGDTAPPRVKILDFGLALAQSDGSAETGRVAVGGTPAFMAPEQASGKEIDGRADLFSLGCVLYRMAAGRLPFAGDTAANVLIRVAIDHPPPLRAANPGVPPALELLVDRLLSKNPADRPASADETAAALGEIEAARRPKPSRRRWLVGTAAAVLGAAGLTALAARRFASPADPPPEPGEVAFAFDAPDARIVLRRDDEERTIDAAGGAPVSLPPGEYAVRPAADVGKRFLWPGTVVVASGEKKSVALQLLGEIAQHREHALPVSGVAGVARKDAITVISVSHDRTLIAWNPAAKDRPTTLRHRDSPLRCVAVGPDGRTAATGCGDTGPRAVQAVRFWDIEKLDRQPGDLTTGSQVNALAFSPDRLWLASGENDGTLKLWDLRVAVVEAEEKKAHPGGVFAVAYLPGGKRLLTAGGDGAVVERSAADLAAVRTLAGHTKPVRALVVLAGGKQAVSAGDDSTVRVWTLADGTARSWAAPSPVAALAASPDGCRLVTGDAAGAVRVWDIAAGREVVRFDGHAKAVTAVAVTPDGRRAVSGGTDGTVRLWALPK